jgi:hypothetical protein
MTKRILFFDEMKPVSSSYCLAMGQCKSSEDKNYWAQCWLDALANMPRSREYLTHGSPKVLRMLLGYKSAGMSCSLHVSTATGRGTKPRGPKRQALLKMLASPNGKTIARAIAINHGIDLSRWPHW